MAVDGKPVSRYTSADIATTSEVFRNRPQVWPELRQSYGQGILTTDIIGILRGSEKVVSSESIEVHEKNAPFRTMKVGSVITGGATPGVWIEFTLDPGDLDSLQDYYPRKGQQFWVGSAKDLVSCVIDSISVVAGPPDTVTIKAFPRNVSKTLATYITPGMVFPLAPSVNAGQGTGPTDPTMIGHSKYTYYTEVLKDALGYENAEFARDKYDEYKGIGMYNDDITRLDMNLDITMEAKCMFGEANTNTAITQTSVATGKQVQVPGTQGIWDWIQQRGKDITFTNATDFTIEHYYQIAEYGETIGLPNSTWLQDSGGDLLRRIERSCKGYITNATGSLNEMFTPDAGGGKKDLTIGFKHITIGSQTIILKSNYIMNNPYLFGIPTLGLKDAAALYPIGDVRDGKTDKMIPNLQLLYRGLAGYKDRKRVIAPYIGIGGPKGSIGGPILLDSDVTKVNALVDFGLVALEMYRGMRILRSDI